MSTSRIRRSLISSQLDTHLTGEISAPHSDVRRLETRAWTGIIGAFLRGLTAIIHLGLHLPH